MRIFLTLLVSFLTFSIHAQNWNPNAGLIKPYKAQVTVSSGRNSGYINDNNPNTYWESGNPLPQAYLSEPWNNIFLNPDNFISNLPEVVFDGNTNTKGEISAGEKMISLKNKVTLLLLTIKAEVKDSLKILVHSINNKTYTYYYVPTENYKVKSFQIPTALVVKSISLQSHKNFGIFELGALSQFPVEFVTFNLNKQQNIGWLTTRQLNESVKSIEVLSSPDSIHWKKVITLNPKAIPLLQIPLPHTFKARFLKIQYHLPLKNYVKARLWEFNIYNAYGPYGAPPPARPSKYTYENTFGINTIWGWGYNVYSDLLKPGTGPGLFDKVAHQLRTYHRLDWDMKTPQNPPDFNAMAMGKGTPANYWLNWDREYKNWLKYGFSIDVTLTFKQDNFPDSLWHNTVKEAENYGMRFGNHFFNQQHLVKSIEIGNEPWDYNKADYRKILLGMSKGIKSVCKATVLPCATQAWNPYDDNNNYIHQYIHQDNAKYLDGLNTHIYSYVFKENGTRIAVNPENRRSEVWAMANLVRYRNTNMPGKVIYVTEFGYDSNGGKENCTHSECVSELNQAAYGVRMALILWRLGATKLYWYYFANVQYRSFLHNRSGLCGSYATGFTPKKSFFAFEKMLQLLGPYRFEKIITENPEVYAYLYKNPRNQNQIIIAWRPTQNNTREMKWVKIPFAGNLTEIGNIIENQKVEYKKSPMNLNIKLSGLPVYLKIKH